MKLSHIVCASVVSLLAVSSASAADVVVSVPVAPQPAPATLYNPYSFDGLYAGLQAGGTWLKQDTTVDSLFNQGINSADYFSNANGFLGGVYLGYNYHFSNNVVAGLETDFAWGDTSDSYSAVDSDNVTIGTKIEERWNGATRVRLGYAFDRALPYIAGGVAYSQIKNSVYSTDSVGTYGNWDKSTNTGFTVGAGMDYAVTDNVLLRLEYRYADYGNSVFNIDDNGVNNVKANYSSNDVRVGVAYKF